MITFKLKAPFCVEFQIRNQIGKTASVPRAEEISPQVQDILVLPTKIIQQSYYLLLSVRIVTTDKISVIPTTDHAGVGKFPHPQKVN